VSLFSLLYFKFQHGIFRKNFIAIVGISIMTLGESMLSDSTYLIKYAITLAIGFYFISNFVSRAITLLAILISLGSMFA